MVLEITMGTIIAATKSENRSNTVTHEALNTRAAIVTTNYDSLASLIVTEGYQGPAG